MKGVTQYWKAAACSFGDCIEVRSYATEILGDLVEIRSTNRPTTILRVTTDEWHAFLDGIRNGEFGL